MIVEKVTEVMKFADYHGAPYDTQITIQWITPAWVNLKNLSGNFSESRKEALHSYLREQGAEKVTYIRYKNGVAKPRTVPV